MILYTKLILRILLSCNVLTCNALLNYIDKLFSPLQTLNPMITQRKNTFLMQDKMEVEFECVESINKIPEKEWNSFARASNSSAFLQHSWLRCLEESGCASPKTGWVPQHVILKVEDEVLAYMPMYIKGHSMGEFIFDNAWAQAAYQAGINYYPKLLIAVPFTPATASRIIFQPNIREKYSDYEIKTLYGALLQFLKYIVESNKLSSFHVNFCTNNEATSLAGYNLTNDKKLHPNQLFARRATMQYHWSNYNPATEKPFTSFDEYLSCFKAKRRTTIKRERRYVKEDSNVTITTIRGKDILEYPGLMKKMYEIYKSTIDKMWYGRQYLTEEFFEILGKSDFVDNLCFMCAHYKYDNENEKLKVQDIFAGTFNVIENNIFYGRYWGCLQQYNVKHLHFEACYWSAIEYCIQEGLEKMEPGAGGGDYKFSRGFEPSLIHSVHYVDDFWLRGAIWNFLEYEKEDALDVKQYLMEKSVLKK